MDDFHNVSNSPINGLPAHETKKLEVGQLYTLSDAIGCYQLLIGYMITIINNAYNWNLSKQSVSLQFTLFYFQNYHAGGLAPRFDACLVYCKARA